MNEFDSWPELEPDQQTLRDAWKQLAETLVIHAKQIDTMDGDLPATPLGSQPYLFTHHLDRAFTHSLLLDDKSHAITNSTAEFHTPFTPDQDKDIVVSSVDIRWTASIQGSPISINHSISIDQTTTPDGDTYTAYTNEEYIETLPDGTVRHILRSGLEYDSTDDNQKEDFLIDMRDDRHTLGVDEIDKIHAVAQHIKSL